MSSDTVLVKYTNDVNKKELAIAYNKQPGNIFEVLIRFVPDGETSPSGKILFEYDVPQGEGPCTWNW